jgi:hypothetical protein
MEEKVVVEEGRGKVEVRMVMEERKVMVMEEGRWWWWQ